MIAIQTPYGRLTPQQFADYAQDLANECEAAELKIARLEGEVRAYREKYEPEGACENG